MSGDKATERRLRRARRHARILKTVRGTGYRPRLVVSRSHKNTEGQIVDDDRGETIVGASTRSDGVEAEIPEEMEGKVAEAFAAGVLLARRARDEGVQSVVFDRAGYPYHGRVKAFAEGAREGGLEF